MTPLSNEELTQIRERVEAAKSHGEGVGTLALGDVPKLLVEIDSLRAENSRLCPIGDMDTISTLQTDISYRDEVIAEQKAEIERLKQKQRKKEIISTIQGGGICPSCNVRLIGKANYCGKCGQRIGWGVYGGNVYDKEDDRV